MSLLDLENPILISSNAFSEGKNGVMNCLKLGVGAVITKSIYVGDLKPTSDENRIIKIGNNLYNNTRYSKFSSEKWYEWLRDDFGECNNIIPNLVGADIDLLFSYIKSISALNINVIEFGMSCPNDANGLCHKDYLELIKRIKKELEIKVIIKISCFNIDFDTLDEYINAGIDAVTVSDAILGTVKHKGKFISLGCSGEQIKPFVFQTISILRRKYPNLTIIGVGGILEVDDIVSYLELGCEFVQLCSVLYIKGVKETKEIIKEYIGRV